jgi:hypothetical protein
MEGLFAEHQKLIDEDTRLETEIKALDNTTNYHTVENRMKRKRMQEVRQQISKQMEVAKTAVQRAMQQMQELLQNRGVQSETGQARGDVGVEGDRNDTRGFILVDEAALDELKYKLMISPRFGKPFLLS